MRNKFTTRGGFRSAASLIRNRGGLFRGRNDRFRGSGGRYRGSGTMRGRGGYFLTQKHVNPTISRCKPTQRYSATQRINTDDDDECYDDEYYDDGYNDNKCKKNIKFQKNIKAKEIWQYPARDQLCNT